MPSKNSSIVLSNIKDHFNQIIEQDRSLQVQLRQIDTLIVERENALRGLVVGFEKFLHEFEEEHPKNRQWNKTLDAGWQYLKEKDTEE